MSVSSDILKDLIEPEDPIDPLWKYLLKIWNPRRFGGITQYYRDCEKDTLILEKVLDEAFPSLYEEILPSKCFPNTKEFERPVIWLDGMSLREARLLVHELDGLEIVGYAFSSLPSNTSSYREETRIAPLMIRDPLNALLSGMLSGDEEEIWCSFPDRLLEETRGEESVNYKEVYEKSKEALLKITKELNSDQVTVTSDHGYFDIAKTHMTGSDVKKRLSELFGNDRSRRAEDGNEDELKRLVGDGHVVKRGNLYLIRGRRTWTKRGKYKRILHGGVSLMECLVPIIRMKVRGYD